MLLFQKDALLYVYDISKFLKLSYQRTAETPKSFSKSVSKSILVKFAMIGQIFIPIGLM